MAIGDLGFGQSALQGFQLGREFAGSNALGTFVKGIMNRVDTLQTLQAKTAFETKGAVDVERAKGQVQRENLQALFQTLPQGGTASGSPGAVITGMDVGGLNVEFPGAKATMTQAEEGAKQLAQVAPIAQSLQQNLERLRRLSSTVVPPQPGFPKKFLGEANLRIGGATGKFPQVSEYQNTIRSMAGELARVIGREPSGRLSDQDIQRQLDRVEAGIYGTQEQRDLAFLGFVDAMNRNPQVSNAIGRVNPTRLLSPEAILRARAFEGRQGKLLRDAEGNLAIEYLDGTLEEF